MVDCTTDGRKSSALVVETLAKRFGDRIAFQDVSFEVGYGGSSRPCSIASG
jgi:hypothetical protein